MAYPSDISALLEDVFLLLLRIAVYSLLGAFILQAVVYWQAKRTLIYGAAFLTVFFASCFHDALTYAMLSSMRSDGDSGTVVHVVAGFVIPVQIYIFAKIMAWRQDVDYVRAGLVAVAAGVLLTVFFLLAPLLIQPNAK
jgi:hypothetical protein